MIQITTSKGLQTLPRRFSYWMHRNGNIYQVTSLTNLSDRQKEYPVTINYVGPNGKEWSKTAYDWFEKMTSLTDVVETWVNFNAGQELTPERIAGFKSLWRGMMQQAGDGDGDKSI